jgi:hypothetical protein
VLTFVISGYSTKVGVQNLKGIHRRFPKHQGYKRGDSRQVSFEDDLLDFIALDGVPLDTVGKFGFVKMIKNLNGSLWVPSRRTVGRRLNDKHQKVQPK